MNARPPPGLAYDPNNLLDALKMIFQLKNDAALSRTLEIAPPIISKIRHRRLPLSAAVLIRIHDVTELSIEELQAMMGDRRAKFRMSTLHGKPQQLNCAEL